MNRNASGKSSIRWASGRSSHVDESHLNTVTMTIIMKPWQTHGRRIDPYGCYYNKQAAEQPVNYQYTFPMKSRAMDFLLSHPLRA